MNKSEIYGKLLLANSHAKEMNMNSVDAVYPEEFTEAELKELELFIDEKLQSQASEFSVDYLNHLSVHMSHCTIEIYKK